MKTITARERLLASTMICGAAVALFGASQAMAQTAAPAAAPEETAVEEIVVTGSLFRRTDTETPSPVTVLTTETLQRAGITTATDAIRSISADGAGSIGTGFQSGFSAGGSAVSLRGLGVSSTLVLVDGLRSANFPISDDGHNAYVDLNSIPFSLIDRVEVLKDGASSTYGADAIGGVVNLIMKKQFTGIAGSAEFGQSQERDARHTRGDLTFGIGDYAEQGWNFYVNGEYQKDGRVTNHSRGFPYNTLDLSRIGGLDNNTADSTLTTATPSAVVVRTNQTDLNNPLAGGAVPFANGTYVDSKGVTQNYSNYTTLNLNCANGTYNVTGGGARGAGCKYDLVDLYNQIAPKQERYAFNTRLSVRLADNIEAYATAGYSRDFVSIKNQPRALRNTQPFGGKATQASTNPGLVLPVYICSAGTNCATASDRRLNPNNPYATAFANDPANGAARTYYLFGDIPAGSDRTNEVIRGTVGLKGDVDGDWNWRVEAVGAKDKLSITQYGFLNIANLMNAINTGAYNFVNPNENSAAVRNFVSPNIKTPSDATMMSLDASVTKRLWALPGGDMQLAVGGQVRREELTNNNQNAKLDTYTLTTSSAFGKHTVSAAYAELLAPVLDNLEVNASGRYDHYSEGFGHFSPKIGVKYTALRQLAFRGTFSKGFRAPTFAESNAASQYAGFATYATPASFQNAHGGLVSGGNTNPYAQSYALGGGYGGNPKLKPELSRSFTAGLIAEPTPWLSLTVDYYNVKKSRLIVAGPLLLDAKNAYYTKTNATDACAAVAAIGPGYSCNLVDAVDPLFPTALPRVLIINAPYENVNFAKTSGIDFSATAKATLPYDVKFTSRLEATHVIQYDLHTSNGVQKYAGTLGPYQLSSGNGTPDWRGNWQNTFEFGRYSLSATAYYVGKIKSVAADQRADTSCRGNVYSPVKPGEDATIANRFCHIKEFINVDMNGTMDVTDSVTAYVNVGNVFNERAPVAAAAYSSAPNYLTTFHYAGLVGRTFKAGIRFKF
ncbi:TonB-dependent receptor domain-containing protein [Caulobacter sp. AP07]|uniref:TonB-dependent receptor domain-containing protein n=1 Tax=Caulobacter sp. AP07 TaxID=1144304 RepID=UPI00054DC7F1|nr:TonB-dependent receptor [Caulobacter sp. AP07]